MVSCYRIAQNPLAPIAPRRIGKSSSATYRPAWLKFLGALSICLSLAACSGSDTKPDRQIRDTEAAITEAESAGARDAEPVLLNQARTKLRTARQQIEAEEHEKARRTLNEAEADAQLAKARAETQTARRAAEEVDTNIRMLRQQMNSSNSN